MFFLRFTIPLYIQDTSAKVFQEPSMSGSCLCLLCVCQRYGWAAQTSSVSALSTSVSKEQTLTYAFLLSPAILSGFIPTTVQDAVGNLASFPTGWARRTDSFQGGPGQMACILSRLGMECQTQWEALLWCGALGGGQRGQVLATFCSCSPNDAFVERQGEQAIQGRKRLVQEAWQTSVTFWEEVSMRIKNK